MNRLSKMCLVFAIVGAISSVGCQPTVLVEAQQFQKLFLGYQLLLVTDMPVNQPIELVGKNAAEAAGGFAAVDSVTTYPLEQKFVPDRAYVFRKTNKTSEQDMAFSVFPARLLKIGARVTKAPKSSQDLFYPFIGEPLFTIEFEREGHHGRIFNRFHSSKQGDDMYQELVFVYQ